MKLSLLLAASFCSFSAVGQQISYDISFQNAVHHEAQVSLTVTNAPSGALLARMSRSSPGRYATHEFGKNVYNVSATDEKGVKLAIEQVEGDAYRIEKHGSTVKISYTVFGNYVDGTYLGIDEAHAHLNMPATFMWVKGLEKAPIQIRFDDLGKYNWKVLSQLFPTKDAAVYTAPGLQYFMDSPTELSDFKSAVWKDVNTDKKVQQLSVNVHSYDDQETIDEFGGMVERVVKEAKAVFGELPAYDNGTYKFIYDLNTSNNGDGMEHRNSTIITSGRADKIDTLGKTLLGTFAHEFFHCWNVERIRPKSLEPFNFEHANMSNELWFAEGFTQYYGTLLLKRAGFTSESDYLKTLGGTISSIINSPGAAKFSPTQMSRYAVFVDAGISVDQNNYQNIFASYYTYGAFTALALDLRLRSEFKLTLDDYMQAVWKAHGKTEIPYAVPDLQQILSKLTNNAFADDFFKNYVYAPGKNDYQKLLAFAGLTLRKSAAGKASLGPIRTTPVGGKLMLASGPIEGTTVYDAGLSEGDYILKLNGNAMKETPDIKKVVDGLKPGDKLTIDFEHRGLNKTATVSINENTGLEVVPSENQTAAQKQFRDSWLSTKIK